MAPDPVKWAQYYEGESIIRMVWDAVTAENNNGTAATGYEIQYTDMVSTQAKNRFGIYF